MVTLDHKGNVMERHEHKLELACDTPAESCAECDLLRAERDELLERLIHQQQQLQLCFTYLSTYTRLIEQHCNELVNRFQSGAAVADLKCALAVQRNAELIAELDRLRQRDRQCTCHRSAYV